VDYFQKLIEHLSKEAFVVIVGDLSVVPSFPSISHRVLNLGGSTSLRELMALIQIGDLLITNDSGPMHMGAALETPLVALFGSTDPMLTGPYGHLTQVMQKKVACSPCFKRTCPIDFRCMRQITPEEVLQRAMQYVQKTH
jgi:heptosyltransferase-2